MRGSQDKILWMQRIKPRPPAERELAVRKYHGSTEYDQVVLLICFGSLRSCGRALAHLRHPAAARKSEESTFSFFFYTGKNVMRHYAAAYEIGGVNSPKWDTSAVSHISGHPLFSRSPSEPPPPLPVYVLCPKNRPGN